MNNERENQNEVAEELFDDDFFSLGADEDTDAEENDGPPYDDGGEGTDDDADGGNEEPDDTDDGADEELDEETPEDDEDESEDEGNDGGGADAPEGDESRAAHEEDADAPPADFETRAAEDLAELSRLYPELGIHSLRELKNAKRFGELREKGLSVREAFYATNADMLMQRATNAGAARASGKAHLGSVKGKASTREGSAMTGADRAMMREFFGEDAPSSEIEKYWRQAKK